MTQINFRPITRSKMLEQRDALCIRLVIQFIYISLMKHCIKILHYFIFMAIGYMQECCLVFLMVMVAHLVLKSWRNGCWITLQVRKYWSQFTSILKCTFLIIATMLPAEMLKEISSPGSLPSKDVSLLQFYNDNFELVCNNITYYIKNKSYINLNFRSKIYQRFIQRVSTNSFTSYTQIRHENLKWLMQYVNLL